MEEKVVVRFAPSPTGYLHIGGARTAIFNWLYAQKTKGKFILRIEDTDAERSSEDSIQGIVDGLKWLGLSWDEGPNFQSQHLAEHVAAAQKLIEQGHAYRCFCSKEEIEAKREAAKLNKETFQYDGTCRNLTPEEIKEKTDAGIPFSVRLKVPEGDGGVTFEDAVYGTITKNYADLEDFIIVRSNGKPLYVLCNAVDDIHDHVTHIIRGQDGLANTPKQVLLYKALGADLPVFAHMSLTLDPKKAKISKRRHGERVAVHYYREKGFLPWAFVNFLVLLGWATKESQQTFTKEELIEVFDLSGISKTNSVFNIDQEDPRFFTDPKALNMNAAFMRAMDLEDLFAYVKDVLEKNGLWQTAYDGDKREWLLDTIDTLRERFHVLTDFAEKGRPYFSDDFEMDEKAFIKIISDYPDMKQWLSALSEKIENLDAFDAKSAENAVRELLKETGVKAGILVNAIRLALTGTSTGPDFVKSLLAVGQARMAARLKKAE